MSTLLALALVVAGLYPAVLCHPAGTAGPETLGQELPEDGRRLAGLVSSNAHFACSLYKQLASTMPHKNLIFSPLSISTALAFLSLGARNSTLTELLEGLKFNLTETPEMEIHRGFQQLLSTLRQPRAQLQLSLGNALFVRKSLEMLATFAEGAKRLYGSAAIATDFQDPAAAERLINSYVEKETQGKIVDLIRGLDPQTAMVLVNYIFFKANWEKPFDPRDTIKSRFQLEKGKWVPVPMMTMEDFATPYFRDQELSCTVVQLNYLGNASALFILPDEGKMEEVEAKLSPETLSRWRSSVQKKWIDELHLPKFSISSDLNLKDLLSELGIREVFTTHADLSGVMGVKNMAVSQVVHKAVLDVAEKGTEAAAATGVKVSFLSGKLGPVTAVHFNRPFLAAIIPTDMASILFLSKVVNPTQA